MAITTRETTATGVTNKGSPLTNAEVDTNFVELKQGKLANTVEDTSPQLGGDLDLNSNNITGTGGVNITGNIALSGTVDGRDVAADGTKLDGIESNATADQTNAEIRAAVEAASDSNVFTDADHTKLNGIETSATADQTAAEIRALVESATDSNVFTDADHTKLNGIEASADVTDAANVTTAGALMDSEVTNLAQVKAFSASDYATAAQGAKADSALQNVVEDTSPQLGGNLDFNGNLATTFTSTGIDDNATGTRITVTDGTTEFNSTNHQLKFNGSADDTYIGTSSSNNGYSYIINYAPSSGTGNNGIALYDSGAVEMWSSAGNVITGDLRIDASGNTTVKGFTSTGIDDNATSTAITIDAAENVGIGTASPDANLEIREDNASGLGAALSLTNSNTSGATGNSVAIGLSAYAHTTIDSSSYRGAIIRGETTAAGNGHSILFETSDTSAVPAERVRIDHDGNVGIGATTVNRKLELAGNNNGGAKANYLRITDTDTTATAANQQGGIEFYASDSSGGAGVTASMEVVYAGSGGGGEITFNTAVNSGAGVAEAMRIDEAGNVGIGSASNHAGARVVINDTPPTAFGSPMLQVGQETFTASGYYSIGLGYTAGSYTEPPAEIAAVATSSSGGTTADIVFGTRSVTTNTAVTERMRIDSDGAVGIGTAGLVDESLSLLATHNLSFAESSNSSYANIFREASSAATVLASGYRRSGTANKMDSSIAASWAKTAVWAGHESIRFYVDAASADAVGTDLTPTERMRVKATGVGIGTTSPNQLLTLGSSTSTATIGLDFETAGTVRGSILMNAQTGEMAFTSGFSSYGGFMTFDCNGAERMRIDTSGNISIATTSSPLTFTSGNGHLLTASGYHALARESDSSAIYINKTGYTSGNTDLMQFRTNGTSVGELNYDGTDVIITQASDERLKNNITDSASAGLIIDAMQVRSFDWNDGAHVDYGFVAQELNQAYEPATKVGGDDVDEEPWGIKTQKLIPLLVKEIQDLRARVAQLEGE